MNKSKQIEKDYSAIILAAGKSERLGFPKLSLKYSDQYTFVEQIANEYNLFGCKEIIVVANQSGYNYIKNHNLKFPKNIHLVINEYPEWHRFYSLKIGVKALRESHSVIVHNVDNPFVNRRVLDDLLKNINTTDYVIPEYENRGGHPFLISKKIVNDIKFVEENQIHLKEFLNQYAKLKVPVQHEEVLVNINTMDEYRKYFGLT
ncbi:MAG: hypothetical protein C0597_10630 [Marinilabiliales bacterium]|nr:MAG: hypothetical protein C0597_10630 [Marinilabiliales bacterium]